MMGAAAQEELFGLFPELRNAIADPQPARPLVAGKKARKLAMRHAKNGHHLTAMPRP